MLPFNNFVMRYTFHILCIIAYAELWPQCVTGATPDSTTAVACQQDRQSLAICKEVDSLLANLQNSWQALHQHSQACSVLGLGTDSVPCSQDKPYSLPISGHTQQQLPMTAQWSQQPSPTRLPAAPQNQCSVPEAASEQQQQHAMHDVHHQQRQQPSDTLGQATRLHEHDPLTETAPSAAKQGWSVGVILWGHEGLLLGLHKLWEYLMHDTQVVSAAVGGACCSVDKASVYICSMDQD